MAIIIKNLEQIEGIRKSSQLAGQTLNFIEEYVKPGIHTEYLDDLMAQFIQDNGAISATLDYHGYPKSSCISPNNVICHGIPSKNTILKEGDIINIDVTTILNGYFGDTSRMYKVGEISQEAQSLIDVTKHCLNLGIHEVKPKNSFGNIGYVIGRYAQAKGYSVVYEFCGHGVGLEFHEDPQVDHIARRNSGQLMKPGMIFTIEPMINMGKPKVTIDEKDGWTARTIDNKLSAQFEHTVLVTPEGFEVLTDVNGEFN
ncbi:MAG: type I methionyl aminopeptidase [Salinivirgaceae bacterium]|nr:type I methionyl aminopeptidase [Salinivirgaceae bacterium]